MTPPAPSHRPNVLWIVLEDTSPRFGCYGDPVATTPAIDGLATEGCRFPNAFASSPVCSPSRSALHTGCYQTAIGTQHHRTSYPTGDRPAYEAVPPHYVRLLSESLRGAGYYCVMAGDTDFGHATPISAFDECESTNSWDDGRPDWMVETAHWRHRPDDRPFFAVVNPSQTHESGMFVDPEETPETNPDEIDVPPYYPDTPVVRRTMAHHYDNLERADSVVGDVLNELRTDGLADSTVVMLLSDHGEGMPRAKRWLYDSGIRVPLIVRWPGEVPAGTVDDRLVSLVDVAPTVLSLAGVDVPCHMAGQPFLGEEATEREYVYSARDRHDEMYDTVRAVRDDRFKYVRNYHPGSPYVLWNAYRNRHPIMREILRLRAEDALEGAASLWANGRRPAEELYDLEADPHEVTNLADDPDYAPVLERLRSALDRWLDRTDDSGLRPEAEQVEHLWPGGEQPSTAPPTFVPNAPERRATEAMPEGGRLSPPAEVTVYCSTQGAAIVYSTDRASDDRWSLATGPIRLPSGETTIRAKAIRYGYRESEERRATFSVDHPD